MNPTTNLKTNWNTLLWIMLKKLKMNLVGRHIAVVYRTPALLVSFFNFDFFFFIYFFLERKEKWNKFWRMFKQRTPYYIPVINWLPKYKPKEQLGFFYFFPLSFSFLFINFLETSQ